MEILPFLASHGIQYELFEHPPVFTCEEAERLCPPMPGLATKNLFLRDRKGHRHFLVVVPYSKSVDLKALTTVLDIDKLSFASDDRLLKYLGVTPGSVTLLGLMHDSERVVEVILDTEIANAEALLCHPLRNTATLSAPKMGIERFFIATGHVPKVLMVPARAVA
jgi:Ala-tRNA(Pro) deacylase